MEHRAEHLIKNPAIAAVALLFCACSSLPRPLLMQVHASDYVEVPYPPRTPPVDLVTPEPAIGSGKDQCSARCVWVDGGWDWDGDRYNWQGGAWVVPPENARLARWILVRRASDGQLFFAPSRWYSGDNSVAAPTPVTSVDAHQRGQGRGDE